MKSKLLIAISALSLIFALPLFAQGQGGGQWGGGQGGAGRAGGFDMEEMQKQMMERAVEAMDTDDDGELSKEEFLTLASNERYSYMFEEDDAEEEESDEGDSEAASEEEATADESEGEEESDEDSMAKLHETMFAEADADDDGNLTVDELIESIDFEAAFERMRNRRQSGGGGNWQRPGGGSP